MRLLFPFPLKPFIAELNLWSWFWELSLPSPQVARFLNLEIFLFPPALASPVLAFGAASGQTQLLVTLPHDSLVRHYGYN